MRSKDTLTLGSLFDGSGGFPLGGVLAGIDPVWASEIEPFPIRVTTRRFPDMKHYGDISQMDGGKIEPVDIITFGSPCTDMSIAGRRAGLDGAQSSLFYHAIRIIKEMRCATNGKYPRWIVWENVPGAFSSNGGRDFKAVLDSIIGIVEPGAEVPMPEKNRWPHADCYMGDGWSVAYRTLDSQYWGVPQRRKRIFLTGDLTGQCAGRVLFESEGLSGYSAESFRAWQAVARYPEDRSGAAGLGLDGYNGAVSDKASTLGVNCGMSTGRNGVVLNDQGGNRMDITEDVTCTLRAESHHPPCVLETEKPDEAHPAVFENHSQDTRFTGPLDVAPTVSSTYGTGGNNQPFVVGEDRPKMLKIRSGCEGGGKGALIQEDKSATLATHSDQVLFVPFCKGTRPHFAGDSPVWKETEVANTLNTFDVGEARCNELAVRAFSIGAAASGGMLSENPHSGIYEADTSRTLDRSGGDPACNQGGIAVVHEPVFSMTPVTFSQVVEDKVPTLTARDYKGPTTVAYGIGRDAFNQGKNAKFKPTYEEELQPPLVAKGPGAVQSGYTVRRLTPTECARLQGFPDWWCAGLDTPNPTEEDIAFWSEVWETHRRIVGRSTKPKSRSQIIKWLQSPHSDSAEYKMWGNGVALPCAFFVLSGIVWCTQDLAQ